MRSINKLVAAKLFTFIGQTSLIFCLFLVSGLVTASAAPALEFGLKRTNTALFFLDYNGDSTPDRTIGYGATTDTGLVGDFDGDTISDLAVYRNGAWYIDYYNDAVADRGVIFGGPTSLDTPIVADFNGDGKADLGLYRNNGFWYFDYNLDGTPDFISPFGGAAVDIPVVADFDGEGTADRAIYRQGSWYVDLDRNGTVDAVYGFGGGANDIPFAADFNNDGIADLGVYRNGIWYIDYDHNGSPDQTRFYGAAGDRPLLGYFNTANSVFVRAGASGTQNGTQTQPFASINSALATNPSAGSILRIAAGSYPERVSISQKSNLTFQGAGPAASHIHPVAGDAFSSFLGQNITLRDLHLLSNGPDSTTPGRGVVNLGSSMTLERVSTTGTWNNGLIAAQYFPTGQPGSLATLTIERSAFNRSHIGNGVQLDTGTTATINRSSASENGTDPGSIPPPPAAPGGRGIVLFNNAQLTLTNSTVNTNYDGGILMTHTANAILRNNTVRQNGTAGVYYELQATGEVTGNNLSENGARGTRGPGGNNGLEIAGLGAGTMTISGNTFSNNTLNGIFIEDGTVNVTNNTFFNNYVGITIANSRNRPVNVTVKGNLFSLPANPLYSEGLFMQSSTAASLTITIGGQTTPEKNTFQNFGSFPAIHCDMNNVNAMCLAGGNIFINSSFPVQNCPACNP